MIRPIATLLRTLRDVLFSSEARGDLLYRGASKWQNLPAGTSGLPLVTGGAGADPAWGTITASTVSDLTEAVQDAVAAMLVEGTNVTLTYDDGAGTVTIDATGGGGGTSDHGALTGLSDDDHLQYPLLAGRSTGQTLIGGTGSAETLTLRSTSHATKAFLTSDQVKVDTTIAHRNLFTSMLLTGQSFTGIIFEGSSGSTGPCVAIAFTSTNSELRFYGHSGSGNISGTADLHGSMDVLGNFVFGKALTTAATNGFPYVSTCPGVPTGTPATKTGAAAFVVNSTNGILYVNAGSGWVAQGGGGGTGTVTSVALTLPSFLAVSGSPVTTAGTLAVTLATQVANTVLAGPATGADAAPTFRALVAADVPDLSAVYSAVGHDHDDLYYTDAEVDTLLASKSDVGHSHTASEIDDFAEAVDDRVAALLVEGSGVTLTYDDGSNTLTIDATGSGGGLANAYSSVTDGTNTSSASGGDTLTLTSANNLLSIVVSSAPDTATFTVVQANLSITASQVSDFSTAADARIAAAVGVSVQAFDSGLSALAAFNTSAFLVQTAANTFAGRTLTGTSNRITVTNGSGVAANPAFDIAATYVGQTSITTLGTITTGVWNGTTIAVANGGTGATSASGARTNLGLVIGTDVLAPTGDGSGLTGLKSLVPFRWNLAAGTPATTGTGKTANLTLPYGGTIVRCTINAKTAPSGQALIVDINLGGTSIWASTQANRIQLAAGATAASQTSFDTTAVSQGDVLTIDIDQVGSGTAGQDVVVELWALLSNP